MPLQAKKLTFKKDDGTIKEMADDLIREYHPEAAMAKICYYWRSKHSGSGDHMVLGKCIKQNEVQTMLHGFNFLIELAEDVWAELDKNQRRALLLHEIKHISADDEGGEKPTFGLRKHDTEEFSDVIAACGLWKPDLQHLASVIRQKEDDDKDEGETVQKATFRRKTA